MDNCVHGIRTLEQVLAITSEEQLSASNIGSSFLLQKALASQVRQHFPMEDLTIQIKQASTVASLQISAEITIEGP